MTDRNKGAHGFRIYRDFEQQHSQVGGIHSAGSNKNENKLMEIALLRKLHAETQVVGFLVYNKEIKGIRFFDNLKQKFIDIAPWHLNQFNMSKLKLMGVREIELVRHEAGESEGTVVLEFLTKHEVAGYFRANRMISNQLAEALSEIMNYMSDEEYLKVLHSFKADE